jgi:hypothetical protein
MAEIWMRLAAKSPAKALTMAERWRDSPFRLVRRLALFAAVSPAVPADVAANMLVQLPAGELFLSGSSVEINRLIHARWKEFPKTKHNVFAGVGIDLQIFDTMPGFAIDLVKANLFAVRCRRKQRNRTCD